MIDLSTYKVKELTKDEFDAYFPDKVGKYMETDADNVNLDCLFAAASDIKFKSVYTTDSYEIEVIDYDNVLEEITDADGVVIETKYGTKMNKVAKIVIFVEFNAEGVAEQDYLNEYAKFVKDKMLNV